MTASSFSDGDRASKEKFSANAYRICFYYFPLSLDSVGVNRGFTEAEFLTFPKEKSYDKFIKIFRRCQQMTNNNTQELFSSYPDILSLENLMEMLQIGRVFAYKLVKSKKVKAIKIGREYKITKASVIELFEKGA